MLYAYCVRRAGEPAPPIGLTGLDGAPVRLIEEGGIGFWVSDGPSLPATAARLAEHDRVVRAALRSATPLPVRYGTGCFPSAAAARDALRSQAAQLGDSLERLAGRVEMGVRIDWTPPATEPESERETESAPPEPPAGASTSTAGETGAGSGRAYLEARRRELRRRDSVRAAAAAALDELERELSLDGVPTVRTVLPTPETAGMLAHLVQTSEIQRYRECVERSAGALRGYRISVSGPWAPYSFA